MQLELQRGKGKKLKKMTISEDVYDRWKDFCDKLGIYNIDLFNTVITSYLDSVNFKSKAD